MPDFLNSVSLPSKGRVGEGSFAIAKAGEGSFAIAKAWEGSFAIAKAWEGSFQITKYDILHIL